ncbi:MAG: TonB-dependent receptor [Pseudomonadota bacterium]
MKFIHISQRLSISLALLWAGVSHAEESDPNRSELFSEEVIVIGTKQDRSLQDTTKSVEVFTAERLREESVFDLGAALSRAANVSVRSDNLNLIRIRGLSRGGTGGAGTADAINIYFDGAAASSRALDGVQTVWDVAQVEVLRGSQSTIQGRNAIGGAVAIATNDPTYTWEGSLRVRAAENDTEQFAGAISGPLLEDELAFRLAADYQSRDTFIDNGRTGEPFSTRENLMLRGKLLWEPEAVDNLRTQLSVEHWNRDGQDQRAVLGPPVTDPDFASFDPTDQDTFPLLVLEQNKTDTTRAILDVSFEFSSEMNLVFKATYEDAERDLVNLDTRTSQFAETGNISTALTETTSAELRMDFEFEKWSGIVGIYWLEEDASSEQSQTGLIQPGFPAFPVNPIDSTFTASIGVSEVIEGSALYTQWRYSPNERWDIDFGVRYDREDFDRQNDNPAIVIAPADTCTVTVPGFLIGLPLPVATVPCTFAGDFLIPPTEPISNAEYSAVLPNLAVTYNIDESLSVFTSYRRGYRAGGAQIVSLQMGTVFETNEWEPEFLDTLEVGWRSQLMDGRLTLNGQVFYSKYEDQQVSVLREDNGFRTVNAGSSRQYGLELMFDYQMNSNWNFYGNLGLLETELEGFFQRPFTTPPIDLSGNELPESPPISMTIGAVYDHDSGVFGSASLNYRDEQWTDIFNSDANDIGVPGLTEQVDEVFLLNAQIGYRFDRFTITLYGTNLLDEDEPELRQLAGVFGPLALNSNFTLRQPRTFGLSLDVSF